MRDGQSAWRVTIRSALEAGRLELDGLHGTEGLSSLFAFVIHARSDQRDMDPAVLINTLMTVTLERNGAAARHVNGVVTQWRHRGADARHAIYELTLRPRMWFMSLGRDRRIFQDQSVPEIVQGLLREYGVELSNRLQSRSYPKREYCVQYDESALDFISRLMEEEGIFYFFEFSAQGHRCVLADTSSVHQECPQAGRLLYQPGTGNGPALMRFDVEVTADGVMPVLADYDYQTASTLRTADAVISKERGGRLYRYPGRYSDPAQGKRRAEILAAALRVQRAQGRGESDCEQLRAGYRFQLQGHPDTRHDVSYVIQEVEHFYERDGYRNQLTVFPERIPYRPMPQTAWPRVNGTHTGVVMGPAGEEIWTDDLGRLKVKFHWDDGPATHQDASCWMRVTQPLAGAGWGSWLLPRVGQEVVVSYLDGDPDLPLVTGTVYNLKQSLPLELPAQQSQLLLRSRSTKSGSGGNELRMEDRKDQEELYLHAQKDMKVEVEALLSTLVRQGEIHRVERGNRTVQVDDGDEKHDVSGKRDTRIQGDESYTNGANSKRSVAGNFTLNVSGNLVIDVTGSVTIKTKAGYSLESASTVAVKGLTIEQKASATQTLDGGGLMVVKGGLVKVN